MRKQYPRTHEFCIRLRTEVIRICKRESNREKTAVSPECYVNRILFRVDQCQRSRTFPIYCTDLIRKRIIRLIFTVFNDHHWIRLLILGTKSWWLICGMKPCGGCIRTQSGFFKKKQPYKLCTICGFDGNTLGDVPCSLWWILCFRFEPNTGLMNLRISVLAND
jgi:hypothetical protein